ncbi:MAG TPA: hypothetical protein PK264_12090, partial [Hyphomicrobiaceae bacterium]|nr:hypothetical protein [Hyphomicrobiaceae bacterium]
SERDEVFFDAEAKAVRARRTRSLDAITLESTPAAVAIDAASALALAKGAATLGIDKLPWSRAQRQLRDRVGFVAAAEPRLGLPD